MFQLTLQTYWLRAPGEKVCERTMVLPRMNGEAWPQRPPLSLGRTRTGSGNRPSVMVAFSTCDNKSAALRRICATDSDFIAATRSHCCRLYLYCGKFAGCLITAPSSGDADALCTQALWAGSCERCAVAAAAVHRLCLPTPAKYTLTLTHMLEAKICDFFFVCDVTELGSSRKCCHLSDAASPGSSFFSSLCSSSSASRSSKWVVVVVVLRDSRVHTVSCNVGAEQTIKRHPQNVNIPTPSSDSVRACLAGETHSCWLLTFNELHTCTL